MLFCGFWVLQLLCKMPRWAWENAKLCWFVFDRFWWMLLVQHGEELWKMQWLGFVPFGVWAGFLENAQARWDFSENPQWEQMRIFCMSERTNEVLLGYCQLCCNKMKGSWRYSARLGHFLVLTESFGSAKKIARWGWKRSGSVWSVTGLGQEKCKVRARLVCGCHCLLLTGKWEWPMCCSMWFCQILFFWYFGPGFDRKMQGKVWCCLSLDRWILAKDEVF